MYAASPHHSAIRPPLATTRLSSSGMSGDSPTLGSVICTAATQWVRVPKTIFASTQRCLFVGLRFCACVPCFCVK
jgi:hypothetical protein